MSTPETQNPARGRWLLYGATAALLIVFALAAGILAGASYALPILVLGVLVLAFFALNDVVARRNLARHGNDPHAAQEDASETVPTTHLVADGTALGDTAEAHNDLSPHDVPVGSPIRPAVEAQAAQSGGTTRGDAHGAAGGRRLRDEEAPPART